MPQRTSRAVPTRHGSLAIHARLPSHDSRLPPFLLVHGAANSARGWTYWQSALADEGVDPYAIDLRGHGDSTPADLSGASMRDYADDVRAVLEQVARPAIVVGWSMGGLAAMLAAERAGAVGCIGLAPSVPAVQVDGTVELRHTEFGPQEYGITGADPDDQPAMPDLDREECAIALASLCRESRYARDERAAGVVIETLPCPLLIVTGTRDAQWPRARYDHLHLPAVYRSAEGASHWGLVLNRRVLASLVPEVVGWAREIVFGEGAVATDR
jgi:pimeloyl-ACP methyl ester carboxylesterase